jgi:hypothetical protein
VDDLRLAPLPPEREDRSADTYLASLGSHHSRNIHRRRLNKLAPMLCRVPSFKHRPFKRALPIRLGAIAWGAVTPELALQVRDRVLGGAPTLRAASASLQPLRGVLRLAIGPTDPGRLWGVLEALRVDGVSHERSGAGGDWFDYERDEPVRE